MLRYSTGERRGAVLLACLAVVLWSAVPATAQSLGKVTLNYIEAATSADRLSNRVSAYVTVSDEQDATITGLAKAAFEVIMDGKPVAVEAVSRATDAMAVILAIDTSGSMQARDKSGRTSMAAAKSAAVEFIGLLDNRDRVALYAFNNQPELRLDFTTDHRLAMAEIERVEAKTRAATCLYDAVYSAIKKAAEIPKGRRAIIVLTDGRDEKGKQACSSYTSNDVIDAATTKTIRVPVYTIGAGPQVDERELGRMASFTGGRYLQAASMDELGGFFRALAGQLKNQYVIKYRTRTPSGEHSLVLKVRYNQATLQDEKRFWSPPLPVLKPPEVTFRQAGVSGPVSGTVTLKLDVVPDNTIQKVRYYVDALLKKELIAAPFRTFQLDTEGLPGGLHIVRAEVIDLFGQSASTEISVNVKTSPPPAPPVKPPADTVAAAGPAASGLNTRLVAVGAAVLVVIAVLVGWALRKRGQADTAGAGKTAAEAPAVPDEDDDGDETLFMPDVETPRADAAATLTVVESDSLRPGKIFHLSGTARVGRTAKNDIDIPDKSVSRKHAELYFENGAYHIRDLGSQNGLKVDEKRVSLGGMPLASGARIRLGPQTVLEFFWKGGDRQKADIDPDDCTAIND